MSHISLEAIIHLMIMCTIKYKRNGENERLNYKRNYALLVFAFHSAYNLDTVLLQIKEDKALINKKTNL